MTAQISNAPREQEMLFIPDAKFRIVSVKEDNRTVVMEELSPNDEVEFDLCRVYDHNPDDIDPEIIEPGCSIKIKIFEN